MPTVFVVTGQVGDPTSNPVTPLPGATVRVETAPEVASVVTDADGVFVLQGLPPGWHRVVATLPGRRTTVSMDFLVDRNVIDLGVPLFTDAQIDSILAAHGAPRWNRFRGLFGLFALRSTGVPVGTAAVTLTPDPGGTWIQTGEGADPIVLVNAATAEFQVRVTHPGFDWADPFPALLRPGVLTFGAPHARPNLTLFVFANRLTGPAVADAAVETAVGPSSRSGVTDFLGQWKTVGLVPGRYTMRVRAAGFHDGLTWPQQMDEDSTVTLALVEPDTLAAWSQSRGGPAPDPGLGHLVLDLRAAAGGGRLVGATARVENGAGRTLAQDAALPALVLDLPPGNYTVIVENAGAELWRGDGVVAEGGAVTFTRLEL